MTQGHMGYMPLAIRGGAPFVFAALCVLGASPPAAAKETIITFDPMGSAGTHAAAINESGAITGYYVDSAGATHGFVRAADGTITTFDPEGSTGTYASGINKLGAIVGTYTNGNGADHGFLRAADGTTTTWRVKHLGLQSGTGSTCINDSGTIAGNYWYWNLLEWVGSAYVRNPRGKITSFESGGGSASINNQGSIAGSVSYTTRATWSSGFVRASDGTVTEFNVLGPPYNTYANSINGSGSIVGNYVDGNDISHGYLRFSGGIISTFDVPDSTGSDPYGINDKGSIAGDYMDSNGVLHGFVEINGKLKKFDPPGSTSTFVYSINNAGSIAGDFTDGEGVSHGFVRIPLD